MIKNSPFAPTEIDMVSSQVVKNDAKVIAMPDGHVEPPYDTLLSVDAAGDNNLENDNPEDNKRLLGTVN